MKSFMDKKGFTLIELIIVIVIIGILAAVATSSLLATRARANEGAAQGALKGIQAAAVSYRMQTGAFPADLATMGTGYLGGGLESGESSGYSFEIVGGSDGETYTATAIPKKANVTGVRSFCTDVYNAIYIYNSSNIVGDGVNCPSGGSPLMS